MTSPSAHAAGSGAAQASAPPVALSNAAFDLVPASDVIVDQGRMVATSREPWLRFASPSVFAGKRYVEITYRLSLYDDPVRPVLRFVARQGSVERILPAPVAGAAIWRGAVPAETHDVLISPVAREGRFDFAVETIRGLTAKEFLGPVWNRRRKTFVFVLLRKALGFHADAENAVDWTTAFTPLAEFTSWYAARARASDLDGFDAPRCDWDSGPRFGVVVYCGAAHATALSRTIEALRRQVYSRFKLFVVSRSEAVGDLVKRVGDPRMAALNNQDDVDRDLTEVDWVGHCRPGDEFLPHGFACMAEDIRRTPHGVAFYADELIRRGTGLGPSFKPNWSPLLESTRPYVGRCAFVRIGALSSPMPVPDEAALVERLRNTWLQAGREDVVHLRRWLMVRDEDEAARPAALAVRLPPATGREATKVSVIIPTRDRADLIGPCLDSVLRRSTRPNVEIVIIDNGTRQSDALKVLERAAADKRVRLLARPGPFSFAQLNNDAVDAASGDVLVFLNNDTVVLTDAWLERLAEHATNPVAGAVGARLVFPDGRIQHAGVVVGLGQDAGHFEALVPESAPSWLDRSDHVHEVSAVTAACMAVERKKFVAVGGFDAVNLPIELNDVDLCLRLAERNWQARYLSQVRLIHKQSATRGTTMLLPMSVHVNERAYFRNRWRAVIRDDPFFHPALSLYSLQLALG